MYFYDSNNLGNTNGAARKTRTTFKMSIFVVYSNAMWLYAGNISRTGLGGKFLKRYRCRCCRCKSRECLPSHDRKYRSACTWKFRRVRHSPAGIRLKKLFASTGAASEFIIYPGSREATAQVGRMRSVFIEKFVIGSREGANIILFMNFWSFSGRVLTRK